MSNEYTQPLPLIQGKHVDSLAEYYFAIALTKLDLNFRFHYQIGFMDVAGGVEVDFVVYAPFPTPVEIKGDYWHSRSRSDPEFVREAKIQQYFNMEPIIINADDLPDVPAAISIVRRTLL